MALRDEWKAAKATFEKKSKTGFPPKDLKAFGKGANFGPALKKFEASKTLAEKQSNIVPVIKSYDKYSKMVKTLRATGKNTEATKSLDALEKELFRIQKVCQDATQPPKPSGRGDKVMLVSQRNVASKSKPKWLKVNPIDVTAYLVVDKHVLELEKNGELGFHWINLQKNCNDIVNKSTDAFVSTIAGIDKKIVGMSDAKRDELLKEANEVLRHYQKVVEASINKEVDDYWAKVLARHKHLKDFKKECYQDIVLGGVTIASSAASISMSFGVAAISALAIAKATVDIATAIHKLARSVDSIEGLLIPNMKNIVALLKEREQAGQKMNKAKEGAKEAATVMFGQITERVMTTTSRTEKQSREYYGKLTAVEADAAKLYKKIQEYTSKFPSAPQGLDAHHNADMKKAHEKFEEMSDHFTQFRTALMSKIEYAEWAMETCKKAQQKDNYVATEKKLLTWGGILTGLTSATIVTVKLISKVV